MDVNLDPAVGLLLPLVTGLVEMIKRMFSFDSKYAPGIAMALALILAFIFINGELQSKALAGLLTGLGSSGLYSQGKKLGEVIQEKKNNGSEANIG